MTTVSENSSPTELVEILTGGSDVFVAMEPPKVRKEGYSWSDSVTLSLIQLYGEFSEKFRSPSYKKKQIWKRIALRMQEMEFQVNGAQCEGRWKYLTKAGFTIWERLSVASRASSHVVLRGSGTYRVTRVVPFTIRFQRAVDVAA